MVIARTVNLLHSVLEQARGFDDVELVYTKSRTALTRFMKCRIHQSSVVWSRNVRVRVIVDGAAGVAETDRFDQDSLAATVERAATIARAQGPVGARTSLPGSLPVADSTGFHESTAVATPFDRATMVKDLATLGSPHGATFSGAITTAEDTLCVVNTRGTEAYQQQTRAELNLLAEKDGLSGYSYWVGADLQELPLVPLAREALTLVESLVPEEVTAPGPMTVFLDHYAAGLMIGYLGYIGFGAKAFHDGCSFMSRCMGKRVAASRISVWDDGRNHAGLPSYFDYEGVPRRKVMLIENGIAVGVVTDSATASLVNRANTGHALPMPNNEGPAAMNLFISPGTTSRQRLLASVRRGIYVRRFHYVNVVDPMTALLTGTTKDGCWLVEDGRLTRPVRNMRFTQDALKALKSCIGLSAESRLVEGVYGPVHSPAMVIKNFQFTGVSDQ